METDMSIYLCLSATALNSYLIFMTQNASKYCILRPGVFCLLRLSVLLWQFYEYKLPLTDILLFAVVKWSSEYMYGGKLIILK
jgi:hypothetical protein